MSTTRQNEMWLSWRRTRSEIQRRWTRLTADDLDIIACDRERLIVRIVDRNGIAKVWAEDEVTRWEKRND